MSRTFSHLPLKRKLMVMFLFLSALGIVVTSAAFLLNELVQARVHAREEIDAQASIVAKNTSAALAFGDRSAAEETLEGLRANPRILAVAIFDGDNRLFAFFVGKDAASRALRQEFAALRDPGADHRQILSLLREKSRRARPFDFQPLALEPVILDGAQVGTVVVQTDLRSLMEHLVRVAGLISAVALATFIFAWFLAVRFQKIISRPILALADIIGQVSREKNYSLRAAVASPDEIGSLITGFNHMLQEIQRRDEMLHRQQQLLLDERNTRIRKLNAAVAQSGNSIVIISPEGTVEYVNPHFCQSTGYAAEEILGSDVRHLGAVAEEGEMWDTVFSGHRWGGEVTCRRKDASLFFEHATISPVLDDAGAVANYIVIKEDITELKRAELELWQAKETAEAANIAKSAFLANMSHEIRTPMNGVIGMTDLCLGTDLTGEQRTYLNAVQYSAEQLLSIINDILDFSKIEVGKIELQSEPFFLRTSVGQSLRSICGKAAEKGIEVVFFPQAHVPDALVGDPGRLRQILINLVGNAIKFSNCGLITVAVSVREVDIDSCLLAFSVRDEGIGIPQDKLDSIFAPFEQGDLSITKEFGGTGLGLSISKHLVDLMGGEMGVTSTEGEGSTFSFTARFALQVPLPKRHPLPLEGRSALVVDDVAINRNVLESFLTSWGMTVTAAEGADAALTLVDAAIKEGRLFDFALIDAQMPGADGWQLAEELRKRSACDPMFCIVMPSVGIRGDSQRCREMRLDGYLIKPVIHSELFDLLGMLLHPERGRTNHLPLTRHAVRENRARMSILVADDVAINQQLIQTILTRFGHDVTVVGNGEDAVQAVRQYPRRYDLVFMDVQMPVMDGLCASRAIRELEAGAGRRLPIVALTAYAMKSDLDRCREAGMDDHLTKPFKADQVQQVLCRFLPGGTEHFPAPPQGEEEGDGADPGGGVIFRREALLDRLGGKEELVPRFVALFHKSMEEYIGQLERAVCEEDAVLAAKAAHAIKGTAGNIGAERIHLLAGAMEADGKAGELRKVAGALEVLLEEYSRFRQECG